MTPKFFKEANNENAAEFKKCLPVNVNTSFKTLAPAIATAEEHWVKPMLGNALYSEAATYYSTNGTSGDSGVMNGLLELLQMAVVRLAYWDSFDQLAVTMADNGIRDTNGENRAYRYQTDALRASLLRQGYDFLNRAIGYCTTNIATLVNFASSEYYTERQASVIHTMEEFDKISSIGRDFYLFTRLRDRITETEQMELPYRIGQSLATAILAGRDNTRFSSIRQGIMSFVVHWTMAEALPFMNVQYTSHGPMVVSEESTGTNAGANKNAPSAEQISAMAERHRMTAERSIGQVVTYLKSNVITFPEIAEVGIDTAYEHSADLRDNKGKKTFLV